MGEQQAPIPKLSSEEKALVDTERKRGFFYFQLPISCGSAYATYFMINRGMIKKTGGEGAQMMAYLPRCSLAFFAGYTLSGAFVMRKIYKSLLEMDGNFSRAVRERQAGNFRMPNQTGPPAGPTGSNTEAASSVLNGQLSEQNPDEPILQRPLSYDDLRRKNRLSVDTPPKQPTQSPPPASRYTPPQSVAPPPPAYKPKDTANNKYGDEWAEP